MSHLLITVSLIYLRGLEIAELKEDKYNSTIKSSRISKWFIIYGLIGDGDTLLKTSINDIYSSLNDVFYNILIVFYTNVFTDKSLVKC
jgi:hypothetical protein